MYYQQYLNDEYSAGAIFKRIFQIIGLIHFLISFLLFIYLFFVYWVFLILPASLFVFGVVWGCLSYLFSKDYMYEYIDGVLKIHIKNSHGKYKLIVQGKPRRVEDIQDKRVIKSTNRKEEIVVAIDKKYYQISPDGYLTALLNKGYEN